MAVIYNIGICYCYCSQIFSILENKLIGNADDSTLMAVVPSPGVTVTVAESLIHALYWGE